MGKLADRAQKYLEQIQHGSEAQSSIPRFPGGSLVTVTDNEGRTRTAEVVFSDWQEAQTGLLTGFWYWLESDQVDSWTHESRIRGPV